MFLQLGSIVGTQLLDLKKLACLHCRGTRLVIRHDSCVSRGLLYGALLPFDV